MPDNTSRTKPLLESGPYQHIGFPQREGVCAWDDVGTTNSTAFADKTTSTTKDIERDTSKSSGRFIHKVDNCAGVIIKPFGSDANNETFDMRVTLWRFVDGLGGAELWVPNIALVAACILGDQPVNNADLTSAFWVDDITVSADLVPGVLTAQVLQPGTPDGTPAALVVETFGAAAVELEFTSNGKTAASMNACMWEF